MRIEDLKAKIWRHFAETSKRRERNKPSQSRGRDVELGLSQTSHWQWCLGSVSSFAVVFSSVFSVSGTNRQPRQQAPCTIRPGFLTFNNSFCGYDRIIL